MIWVPSFTMTVVTVRLPRMTSGLVPPPEIAGIMTDPGNVHMVPLQYAPGTGEGTPLQSGGKVGLGAGVEEEVLTRKVNLGFGTESRSPVISATPYI